MASQTLAQMQTTSTESFEAGIVDEIINVDPALARVPYATHQGTQKTWVRESTRPVPQFFDIDEEISSGVGTKTQVTLTLQQIAHQVETAGFSETVDTVNSTRAINVNDGLAGLMDVVGDKLVYGNNTTNSKEFNGLHAIIPAAQTLNEGSGATGSALNFSTLDNGFDLVKKGNVDVLTVTRAIARRISAFVNFSSTNTPIRTDKNEFGRAVPFYNDTPIEKSDRQVQTETIATATYSAKTGGATSTLFGLQFGDPLSDKPGIFGLQGPSGIRMEPLGWHQTKDVLLDRVVWYLGHGLGSTLTVFAIDGITDAAVAA